MCKYLIVLILILKSLTMNAQYRFPFGEELKNVVQIDTTPKKVFVLGVYASAIHAKWLDTRGKVLIKALAVASEPCIFWTGDSIEALKIINRIKIPKEMGSLIPAECTYNGPSGRCLDSNFLYPLHYKRENAWLCDLVPHSCKNPSQKSALEREYDKYIKLGKLPDYNIPEVPTNLASEERIHNILSELKQSQADTIILLGDQPIKYFLSRFTDKYKKLSDFKEYGKPVEVIIDKKTYTVIALAHPRQVSKLGKSDKKWYDSHQIWMKNKLK
jgi:uracil-DNA glycosylase